MRLRLRKRFVSVPKSSSDVITSLVPTLPAEEQFDREIIEGLRGTPWDERGRLAGGIDEEEPRRPLVAVGGGAGADPPAQAGEAAEAEQGHSLEAWCHGGLPGLHGHPHRLP